MAAKGFSAFNACLAIVKIMTCYKKFPPQIKYKNNDHQTQTNVGYDVNPTLLCQMSNQSLIKFGWQIGIG